MVLYRVPKEDAIHLPRKDNSLALSTMHREVREKERGICPPRLSKKNSHSTWPSTKEAYESYVFYCPLCLIRARKDFEREFSIKKLEFFHGKTYTLSCRKELAP